MDIAGLIADLDQHLVAADAELAEGFPGDGDGRQPVHTVYVPADRYTARTVHDYGRTAQTCVIGAASDFLEVIGGDEALLDRVLRKLEDEPVEDLRIDFEDGYGIRSDDEEDAAARAAAIALRESIEAGEASPFHGIRFKSLERDTRSRGIRTLATFLETLGQIPEGFVVTLPKVTSVAQVEAMVLAAERLEPAPDTLRFELQVETPQAVVGPDGTALVARMIHAAAGPLHRPALRHLRLLRVARHRGGLPEPRAPGRRPREDGDAGGRRRHRRTALRRLHQPGPGGRARRGPRGLGAAPSPGEPLAGARLLPGLGPPPGAAADPVRRDVRVLPPGLDEAGRRLRVYLAVRTAG